MFVKEPATPGGTGEEESENNHCDHAEGSVSALRVRLRPWRVLGFFFLIKKCNQSMFNPTWQRGRWRWMLLLGGAPVVWGVQGHSPSWARLLHSLCPVAASTWQWKLQQQFNSIERSIQGLTLKQTHAKWAPQMCTTISKRTDLRVHASHYKHR